MTYEIYTDGACSVNKRIGGYAAIAKFDGQQVVVHGNKRNATNNEMELLAVISILHVLQEQHLKKKDEVIIYSDSAYVVNAVNEKWLGRWIRNSWRTADNKPVKNSTLWLTLQSYIAEFVRCEVKYAFVKVKGHSDCKLNNYVDRLAVRETQILKDKQLED